MLGNDYKHSISLQKITNIKIFTCFSYFSHNIESIIMGDSASETVDRIFVHAFRFESRPKEYDLPTIAGLNGLANKLNHKLYQNNTTGNINEKNNDTVALAVDTDNKCILVASKVKRHILFDEMPTN